MVTLGESSGKLGGEVRRSVIVPPEWRTVMTEPESHTLAYLRRLDEKFDRLHTELGDRFGRVEGRLEQVEGRLGRIEDELLVLNGIALRLEGREVETTGLKAILDRHERRLTELARRIANLEGAETP
jgi:predicted RNase H-like nuclease (RuvC/YqgF family)